jgi:perosamine synthetase
MARAIPRGTVYHEPGYDLAAALRLPLARLDEPRAVARLERAFAAYVGRAHCVAFPLARTAVWCALGAVGIPRGAAFVMPPLTVKPMMDVVLDRGLHPVFADLELHRYGFDPGALEAALESSDARGVLLTPLYGLVPDMEALLAPCRERGVVVLEDFSHALNASWRGRAMGCFGDVAVYSSSTIKTFDSFGGGLAVTDDPTLAEGLRAQQAELLPPSRRDLAHKVVLNAGRAVATHPAVFSRAAWPVLQWSRVHRPGLYRWLSGYVEVHAQPVAPVPVAWRRRYSGFQAQAGLERLPAVARGDALRERNAGLLLDALQGCPGITLPRPLPGARDVWWQFVVLADHPRALMDGLAERGIDSATGNLDLISASAIYPAHRVDTPRAARLKRHGVFLPIHPALGPDDMARIATAVWEVCE